MHFRHALLALLIATPAPASTTIHHWIDEHGQTHYSDRPQQDATGSARRLPADRRQSPAGLRAGERKTLKDIERRRKQTRKSAERRRDKFRQARKAHRETCEEHRQRQRLGRRHVDGKAISRFLRKHCW